MSWWNSIHMPARKRKQKSVGFQISRFYWPFSSDIMTVKGLSIVKYSILSIVKTYAECRVRRDNWLYGLTLCRVRRDNWLTVCKALQLWARTVLFIRPACWLPFKWPSFCAERWLWENNPGPPQRGIKPAWVSSQLFHVPCLDAKAVPYVWPCCLCWLVLYTTISRSVAWLILRMYSA